MLNSISSIKSKIFSIKDDIEFNEIALEIFRYQAENNPVYKKFLSLIHCNVETVQAISEIPFLPIRFFKSFKVLSGDEQNVQKVFKSSGTTQSGRSQHLVTDLKLYERSFLESFKSFYGAVEDYVVLALLPNYIEQGDSSLIYMVDYFIEESIQEESGYCLTNLKETAQLLKELKTKGKKVLIIGVTYALLDLIEYQQFELNDQFVIMETGGMKGRRKELTKQELHQTLKAGFGVPTIHSEYGMTELLSQAYSMGNTKFKTPKWMKVFVRDINDPLSFQSKKKSGGINIIDLANLNSCSFIATQDLGKINDEENTFEILGRFDFSDTRGCNLLVSE
ncbi:MAG: acyl transferase [Flavobacteriales bacterium]|jgi:phenylacetate-coenzyme A ligase PaaK-like adenylate-forming protein|nr:acyl transferase [Flavobacteriales bacterium]